MTQLFANNVEVALAGDILAGDLSFDVVDASSLPTLGVGDWFLLTLNNINGIEILKCTGVSTNTLTVERAQEGTTAIAGSAGDDLTLNLTKGTLEGLQTPFPVITETTAARTLAASDANSYIFCSNAAGCVLTVPPQSSVTWRDSSEIRGRSSQGTTRVTPGSGVTVEVEEGYKREATARTLWTLKREAEDAWAFFGRLLEDIFIPTTAIVASTTADGVASINIENPAAMVERDFITSDPSLDGAEGVAVDRDRGIVFVVCNWDYYMTAIDVSDPANLVELGTYLIPSIGVDVPVPNEIVLDTNRQIAFVSCEGDDSIRAIDISNPAAMVEISQLQPAGLDGTSGIALDVVNSVAYVTGVFSNNMLAIDVSNAASMSAISTFTSANLTQARFVAIDTGTSVAYIASNGTDGVLSVDISNPASMAELDFITAVSMDGCTALALDDETKVLYAVGNTSDDLTSINVIDPANLVVLDSLATASIDAPYHLALDLFNSICYVTGATSDSITAVNIANPADLIELGTYSSATNLNGVRQLVLI